MALKIVRNDIVLMNTDAIVNPANPMPVIGAGCETSVYAAAGEEKLLEARRRIGELEEGQAAISPGFGLPAKYVIHAVSPFYFPEREEVENKLRSCYRESLRLALEYGASSIAFPVLGTGSYGYPREEGFSIACEEIRAFLEEHDMMVYLVVFDPEMFRQGQRVTSDLKSYIDAHYVEQTARKEYGLFLPFGESVSAKAGNFFSTGRKKARSPLRAARADEAAAKPFPSAGLADETAAKPFPSAAQADKAETESLDSCFEPVFDDTHGKKLEERMRHLSDTFSQYLLYLIESKGMTNAEVYKRALVDKKVFSKIKNNPDYHTQKITALCLCVGAKLNMDETRDLLARAGYALSPCDCTDIIFSFFIENEIYDMIELDIQLEEHGLPCLIS